MQPTKMNDVTIQQVIAGIENRDPHFLVNARGTLGDHQVQETIERIKELYPTKGFTTGLSLIMAELRVQIRVKTGEEVKVLAVGQRDTTAKSRDGKNLPGNVTFLSIKHPHFEIPVWGSHLRLADKNNASLTMPCVATLKIETIPGKNEQINMISIDAKPPLEPEELALKLLGFKPIKGSKIAEEDLYKVFVVQGKVRDVQPMPIFTKVATGEEPNELDGAAPMKNEKTGDMDILMPDASKEPVLHPVMGISLEAEGSTKIRLNVDQRKYLHGVYMVSDLPELCDEAMEKFPDDPDAQARYVQGGLMDRPIIAVGKVVSIRAPKPGETLRYVTISTSCIVDVPENIPVLANDPGQTTLAKTEMEKTPEPNAAIPNKTLKPTLPEESDHKPKAKTPATTVPSAVSASDRPDGSDIHEEFTRIVGICGWKGGITSHSISEVIDHTKLVHLLAERYKVDEETVRMRVVMQYEKELQAAGKSEAPVIPDGNETDEI